MKIQIESLKNNDFPEGSSEYSLYNIITKFPVYRCTACGLSPQTPPSSGYTERYNYVGNRNAYIEYAFTTAAYLVVGKKLGIPYSYVVAFFEHLRNAGYVPGSINVHYDLYQCGHTRCPKAYKEKKVFKRNWRCFLFNLLRFSSILTSLNIILVSQEGYL